MFAKRFFHKLTFWHPVSCESNQTWCENFWLKRVSKIEIRSKMTLVRGGESTLNIESTRAEISSTNLSLKSNLIPSGLRFYTFFVCLYVLCLYTIFGTCESVVYLVILILEDFHLSFSFSDKVLASYDGFFECI